MSRRRVPPTRSHRVRGAALALGLLAACAGAPEGGPVDDVRDAGESAQRVAAIDFGPRVLRRWQRAVDTLIEAPGRELARSRTIAESVLELPGVAARRAVAVPPTAAELALAESERSAALLRTVPAMIGRLADTDDIAAVTARDLERLGFLLGLERRPLAEIDDPEHRASPHDDRPVRTFWDRVWRRVFP